MSVFQSKAVPWDSPAECFVWLGVLVIATFFIHNSMRKFKEKT